jgi:FkbM family methyltransferase
MGQLNRLYNFYRYVRDIKNWTGPVSFHLRGSSVQTLTLRDGHVIHLLDSSAEIWAFQSIFWERCYDRDFEGIDPLGVVLDLGANVGIFTLYAATRLVPRGHVLAVEANPACYAKLKLTTEGCTNVTLWPRAVAGKGRFWLSSDSLGGSVYRPPGATGQVTVPAVSAIDVLHFAPRIVLLKCNMEGAEYPLLLATEPELWEHVERVAIKWHDGEIAQGHGPNELRERLRELGYAILRHEEIWRESSLTTGITTAVRQ